MARSNVIRSSKEILGGTPVFEGTRVPVRTFIDHLEAGDSLDDFLADFPSVSRGKALEVLDLAKDALLTYADEAVRIGEVKATSRCR